VSASTIRHPERSRGIPLRYLEAFMAGSLDSTSFRSG
jgi:hypothetical protein